MNIRWLIFCLLLTSQASGLFAASSGETKAFKQATQMFADKVWPAAERTLADFITHFPNSEYRAEAILYQARATFNQKNFTNATELLQAELPKAGVLADQYHYWMGEFLFQSGQFQQAADKYGEMIRNFPRSARLLEAAYNQALAYSRLKNWTTVIDLLQKNEGAFQVARSAKPEDPIAIHGLLLLGQAFFAEKKFAETERVMGQLEGRTLTAEMKWRQQFLLCRAQFAGNQFEKALTTSSNLMPATVTGIPATLAAESVSLQAEIFEQLKRLPEAIQVHEKNLADGLPRPVRLHSLSKIIELTLAQNKTAEIFARLEKFVAERPNDDTLDLALSTLGELRVREFYLNIENSRIVDPQKNNIALTNISLIQSALTNFDSVLERFPQSELLGKVFLNRGWCFWATDKLDAAKTNFAQAVARLPLSEEQAVARFKLGDAQYKLRDFTNAVSNYEAVLRDFTNLASVQNALFDQALYQIVRASIEAGDQQNAMTAMNRILTWYPNTGFAERARLLVGQDLNRKGSFQEARTLFSEFIARAPDSALLPEVKLALAQTYVQERNWAQGLEHFEAWIATFTNHALLPDAEFSRALATYQSGAETNALNLFTNFVVRFPSNSLAPLAQNWLGDFYFNRDDFLLAEESYQLVGKYNPPVELACQARMGVGRAAFERQGLEEARKHFTLLVNDTNTPPDFSAQAWFALGDTIYLQFLANTNADDFRAAISAFSTITKEFPTNPIVPMAFGRIGECYFQRANLSKEDSASDFASATNAFAQVLESTAADISARSQAQVGLGKIFEMQGNLDAALQCYARVLYVEDSENFDARWIKESGLSAARICENREQWEQAINIYQRLLSILPSLKPALEKKILIDQNQLLLNANSSGSAKN